MYVQNINKCLRYGLDDGGVRVECLSHRAEYLIGLLFRVGEVGQSRTWTESNLDALGFWRCSGPI